MNIDVECPTCQSILRVNSEHAGKQLRCPNCQGITTIPHDGQGDNSTWSSHDDRGNDHVYESAPPREQNPVDRASYDDRLQKYESERIEIRDDNSPQPGPGAGYQPPIGYHNAYHDGYQQPPPGGYPPGAPQPMPPYPSQAYPHGQYPGLLGTAQPSTNSPISLICAVFGFFMLFSCFCVAPMFFLIGLANSNRCFGGLRVVSITLNFVGLGLFALFMLLAFG